MTDAAAVPGGTVADPGSLEGHSPAPAPAPSGSHRSDNPNVRGHSPARDAREAMQARDPEKAQAPDGSERFKFGDDLELTPAEIGDLRKFKAEQDVRKSTLPPSPDKYEIKLPADFKPPEGVNFEFNKDDPLLKRARELAHARGMDQDTFSDFLSVYATNEIGKQVIYDKARNAELAKLGTAAPARIDTVRTWARGTLGDRLGGAIEEMLVSARHIEAFEKIISNASRQGGTQFSQAGRDTEQAPAGSIPGYKDMSFAQKRAAQMVHAGVVNRRGTP